MLTFDEFIANFLNRPVDTDGIYPNQCMDLMHEYCIDVLGLSKTALTEPSAYLVYKDFGKINGGNLFSRITYITGLIPQKGDIVVFGQDIGSYGHVCIFLEGDNTKFKSFDANWPSGTLPHIQDHDYKGVLGWLHFKESNMFIYKYKVGDILEPGLDIPVGESPGKENMNYGHIGFNYKAEIIGTAQGYYNVDQKAIGGGTGWVNAQIVDATPAFIARPADASRPVPPSPAVYSQEQYDAMQRERDVALTELQVTQSQLVEANKKLTGFTALGVMTTDDITKLKLDYETTISGLNKQILSCLDRNKILADVVKKKEDEDFTAIEEGMKMAEKATELESHISQIAKNVGSKPNVKSILDKFWGLFNLVDKMKKQMPQQEKPKDEPIVPPPMKSSAFDWLTQFLGLGGGAKS